MVPSHAALPLEEIQRLLARKMVKKNGGDVVNMLAYDMPDELWWAA